MSSFATELSANIVNPVRLDLSGAYLVSIEAATNDLRLSFEQAGFGTTASYRVLNAGSGLVLDLPRPADLTLWVRGDTGTGSLRVMVFR